MTKEDSRKEKLSIATDTRPKATFYQTSVRVFKAAKHGNGVFSGAVTCLNASQDGLLVTGGEDRIVKMWQPS